ncbi:MAG: bifunctional DNA-formamidopyrimidine glycosylase/DNA-(apurinic or apyrimidinic site) lyase [Calditrichaeota bacterium]|nr:bifunctional DNA-formamidopyrimidine glycosylase/DNA-(apurinic or apyrimidinic site) lyase [Calditrichota bacterium]
MPELPEVETIRRQLQQHYRGEQIHRLEVHTPTLLKNLSPEALVEAVTGKTIQNFRRRGKFLIFEIDHQQLVFHLGMSGIFVQDVHQSRYPRHIHLSFTFRSGKQLHYQDVRKFGGIWWYRTPHHFPELGMEPLSQNFTLNKFKKLLHLRRMNIKRLLMEQSIIAGIGNIYANEMLFQAGISPLRRSDTLSVDEVRRLHRAIQDVLKAAIERFGTTYSAYRTVEGQSGENQKFLKVYHQQGQPCPRCGKPIQKIVLNGRSTFYCPGCQK